jgi:Squalene-hopene cyclase C-terminal domain/ECF-type riboflavin transporter, S component/Prenyltransferase and squalene oxidase repeat
MTWQLTSALVLIAGLAAGFAWYERDKPPARVLALVATMAALAVVGRLAFAAIPNVKPTTDIVLFAGYALGPVPGFVVGAVAALVSNIFLSQGPWTPWQMAAWGAVGIGGAVFAFVLRGREPNRWVLAAVCGLAGFAFGAWMDLYQLTLAAHQNLDSYLAISATSLPYNVAHAVGNVAFSLLIGPVFIRALRRYRRRLEVRWLVPAAATLVLALLLAAPASASPASRAAGWLAAAQNRDGGFGATPGSASSRLYSGWAGLGLAAAGRNPRDVHRRGGRSIAAYELRPVTDIGEVERTVLLASAAGLSPRSFAGKNLIDMIVAKRRPDGSIAGFVSYTTFGVLALKSAHLSPGAATVKWLVGSQNADGGFGLVRASTSDSDMTGATLQALAVVGRRKQPVTAKAVAWLRANQNDDGGFGQFRGRDSNAQSTAYAVQGLVASGAGGATLTRALAYLRGLQRADGTVRYSRTSAQTPVWVTAQALMALERKPLPIATVPRAKRRKPHHAAAAVPGAAKPAAPKHRKRKPRAVAPQATPAGAPPPSAGSSLRLDPANGSDKGGGGSGPGVWIVAVAVAVTLALVFALRRRFLPRRAHHRSSHG